MSEKAIDEGHIRFLEAMRANDADALMAELADDVVFYPPNQAPARGKAAVRSWYEGAIAEATTEGIEVSDRNLVVAGDWGIEQGKYVWKLAPAGGGDWFTATGHFMAIWHRETDGAWRVTSDIWNSADAV